MTSGGHIALYPEIVNVSTLPQPDIVFILTWSHSILPPFLLPPPIPKLERFGVFVEGIT